MVSDDTAVALAIPLVIALLLYLMLRLALLLWRDRKHEIRISKSETRPKALSLKSGNGLPAGL